MQQSTFRREQQRDEPKSINNVDLEIDTHQGLNGGRFLNFVVHTEFLARESIFRSCDPDLICHRHDINNLGYCRQVVEKSDNRTEMTNFYRTTAVVAKWHYSVVAP